MVDESTFGTEDHAWREGEDTCRVVDYTPTRVNHARSFPVPRAFC